MSCGKVVAAKIRAMQRHQLCRPEVWHESDTVTGLPTCGLEVLTTLCRGAVSIGRYPEICFLSDDDFVEVIAGVDALLARVQFRA